MPKEKITSSDEWQWKNIHEEEQLVGKILNRNREMIDLISVHGISFLFLFLNSLYGEFIEKLVAIMNSSLHLIFNQYLLQY